MIADTFGYNVVEALSIISNRTDANVAYLTAGSKKTPMCKRIVNNFSTELGGWLGYMSTSKIVGITYSVPRTLYQSYRNVIKLQI